MLFIETKAPRSVTIKLGRHSEPTRIGGTRALRECCLRVPRVPRVNTSTPLA